MLKGSMADDQRRRASLEAAFASAPSAVAIADRSGVCVGTNPAFEPA
jgi:PAS domain-containing protein